ncbi:MAG: MFS transporter [Galactobacter sp.]
MTSTGPVPASSRTVQGYQDPVRPGWVAGVALANVGVNTAIFATLNQLLPLQALAISGENGKEATLSVAGTVGVIVAMVVNPVVGALSDRTISRWGRRTPWMVAGTLLTLAFLLLLSGAGSVATLCLFWAGTQAGLNCISAAATACVPDRVRERRRGIVGGVVVTGITVGVLLGSAIGMIVAGNVGWGYILAAATLVVAMVPYLCNRDDPALDASAVEPFSWRGFLSGFAVNLRRHRDFAWAWLGRLLMMTSVQLVIVYLLYFLQDRLHHPEPAVGVFLLTAIYAVATVLTAALAGRLSDKTGRRPLVAAASLLVALAAALMVLAPVVGAAPMVITAFAAAILGIGNGAFLGVDFALITQVLPGEAANGRGMGLVNIAASLPQLFSLGLAWLAVTRLGGYPVLFLGAAVIAVLGALSVCRIKSVR